MSFGLWRCCFVTLLALAAPLRALAEDGAIADLRGRWATQGFGSIVEISLCGEGACGHIAWLWDAEDGAGNLRRDGRNPDASLRNRALKGIEILRGFVPTGDGVWRRGRVYNPDDGRTYSGELRLVSGDILELTGCALRVFCQTQRWHRLDVLLRQIESGGR